MICDLASLLGPVTEEIFFAHFLEKERLHVEAGQPDRAKALLPWTTINRLVDADMLPPDRIRVMRASIDIAPKMYRHQDGAQRLRAGALQALLTQGASLVINEIDKLVPQIGRLADTLERHLGHHIAVRAFVSFGQGGALKAHWDDSDVLVVQVHGRKLWRSYGSPTPLPISGLTEVQPVTKGVVWQGVLEPGDMLYLPRGEVHEAALEGSSSVHLTIGIAARRGVDFMRWLSKRAATELAFREDITRVCSAAIWMRRRRQSG
jgi:ribosomal protein L16 Arg81 hydroxylase